MEGSVFIFTAYRISKMQAVRQPSRPHTDVPKILFTIFSVASGKDLPTGRWKGNVWLSSPRRFYDPSKRRLTFSNITRCNISEDANRQQHRCKNLVCPIDQCFSTFVRPRPGKFSFLQDEGPVPTNLLVNIFSFF